MKAGDSRIQSRYKISLPVELISVNVTRKDSNPPPLRFKSVTRDIGLGGALIDLNKKVRGLDPEWDLPWFQGRSFWVHIKGISTIPEGLYTKAKAVHLMGENQSRPEAVGLAFEELFTSVKGHLKKFLDNLTQQ